MFVDLVGSTSLSETLDTEVLRQLIREYQAVCQEAVDRCQGHIAQYLGDGLLIYFGYPHAYGDDARRALTCGLDILRKLPHLNERLQVNLQLRLGVHTGEVIVGEIGAKRESLALGETPNVAARLQGLALPDTMVVSDTTWRLTKDSFRFAELGSHQLKGLSKETKAYRVLSELDEHRRRQRQHARQASVPLIGRDAELNRLRDAWHRRGLTMLVRAEEGMGKRRLVQALKDQAVADGGALLSCYCTAAIQSAPLRPVVDMLERDLGLARDDTASHKWEKLEEALPRGMAPELALPILSRLLLNIDDTAHAPAQTRRLTFQCLHHFVLERAGDRSLLLVVDGVEDADPSTLEWLSQLKGPRLLIVLIGDEPSPADEELQLQRLGPEDATRIVEHFTGDRRLPAEVISYIVARADGVPMFLEEITRLVLDSDVLTDDFELRGSLAHLGVPATLYDSFLARLDRLGPARELLQWGAVLGGDLDPALLQPLAGHSDVTALLEGGLLRKTPNGYAIRHPLIQEVSYRSLLKSTRAEFHRRAAEVLEKYRPELAAARPDLMARHYHEAGLSDKAAPYWLKAGQRALALSADTEAVMTLKQALEHQPAPHTELEILMALGPALIATRGYGAIEVEQAYQRARQLCRNLGDTLQLFPVLCGLWVFYLVRGELDRAWELAEKLERLAQSQEDPAYRLLAEAARGQTAFWRGEFDQAEILLSQAVARHDPGLHKNLAFTYFDTDPVAGSLSYLAWTRLMKGDRAGAREADARARELAQTHAHTKAHCLFFSTWLELTAGHPDAARAKAEELGAMALQESFPLWIAVARVLDSWTRITTDPNAPEQLALALERVQATGARLGGTWFAALPAQMLAAAGQREHALQILGQALITAEEFGERWYEVELRRLRASLLDDPEPALAQARELAQQQNARLWEERL